MNFFKSFLGISRIEEKLRSKDDQVRRLAETQIKLIDLALKQPELPVKVVEELNDARISAAAITISGAAMGFSHSLL